ncbi:MAG: hypothetical protein JNJ54_13760 [Myxococcaceae bacterium]|nr:hypothetical protein [Myxococcaceae bacterium]
MGQTGDVLALLFATVVTQPGSCPYPCDVGLIDPSAGPDAGVVAGWWRADPTWRELIDELSSAPGPGAARRALDRPADQTPPQSLRLASPVPRLAWGMTPDEVAHAARTAFVRQPAPVEAWAVRFFATPHFVFGPTGEDAGVGFRPPALAVLHLRAVGSTFADVAAALERSLGPPAQRGPSWRAWDLDDSRVLIADAPGAAEVLLTSKRFTPFLRWAQSGAGQ